MKKMMNVKKRPSEMFSDDPVRSTLRHSLQGGKEVNVTLAADCERLIMWTNKNLGLYDISAHGEIRELGVTSSPVKNIDMVLASRSYYVIVQKGHSNDEASSPTSRKPPSENILTKMFRSR
jgi:hypothetical protein